MQVSKGGFYRLLIALLAMFMVAAACGGSDDDSSSGSDAAQATASDSGDDDAEEESGEDEGGGLSQDAVEKAVSGESDEAEEVDDDAPTFDRSTLDGLWEEAAHNRARMVAELTAGIESGDWGVGDDNILRGPGDFEIDLNGCPSDWSNTQGVSGAELRLGQTLVQTGNLAAYGNITHGMLNYFDWVNENDGGIGGRPINMIIRDDGYVAAQTIEYVDELIESQNVFAIQNGGSPNGLAVYDKINEECIPHPFYISGHPAWGDPVNHPWTTGMQMSYATEAMLWGTWIKSNLPDELPVKVAGLVMDNDFGLAYEIGFENYAEANPDVVSEYLPVRHDPAAPTLTNEVTTIAAFDPDVFISMTAGNPCLLAIQEVEAAGLLESMSAAFTPSVCKAIAAYMAPAGMAADKWWVVGGGLKDTTDPKYTSEPFISFLNDNLVAAELDPGISLLGTGYMFAYPYVEALRVANELPGGLTRTNFMLAQRNFRIYHPMTMDGIVNEMYGAKDAYFVEGSDFSQFDAVAQTWNQVGDIVDANGGTANCAWDKANGGCR